MSSSDAEPHSAPVLVIDRLDDLPDHLKGGVVAIGNFDGVHRGHQAVLEAALRMAEADGGGAHPLGGTDAYSSGGAYATRRRPVLAMTFEPHPRSYFQPASSIFRLTPPATKVRVLGALGVDAILMLPFDGALAAVSAEDFVARILMDKLDISGATVGWDFHFGHKRRGSPAFLLDAGIRHGFAVEVVPHFDDEGGRPISSSRIRDALADGDLALANGLLGYRWFVEGPIVDGDKRGRELNFPTANMKLGADCRLKHGVYAVTFTVDGVTHMGAASYGRRPQFDNGAPVLETYVLDFSGNLYGKSVRVGFVSFLRPELKFETLDGLLVQMTADCEEARAVLSAIDPGSAIDRALAVMNTGGPIA